MSAGAAATAGATTVAALIQAQQEKKRREMEARQAVGTAVTQAGAAKSNQLQQLIANLRASLVG